MKKFYLTITAFLLFQISSNAQLEFFTDEQQQKILSEKFTDAIAINIDSLMLDSIITKYRNSESVPGIATLIIKDNEVIWNKNYGYRNLEYQLPVEDSTLFIMASISKTFVATAVMQLWENGLINLDGNINDYLPSGFTVVNPYYPGDIITVKMLLTHTSSIQDNWGFMLNLWGCGDHPVPYDSFLVNYFTPGGSYYSQYNFYNYPPGQNYNYTNAGCCLLALMVEHLSSKSFNDYSRDSIFIPLSMNSTSWFLEGLDTNKIAIPYWNQPPIPMCHFGFAYWPIAQLRTNKFELSNFLQSYINGGIYNNNRILNSSTIQFMLSDQLGYPCPYMIRQGIIWYTYPMVYNTVWGHDGEWDGIGTFMACNQSENWAVIFFINFRKYANFILTQPVPQMAQYAHLFGNIYALGPSVDKSYARKNIDPVLFRTRFSNIYNHQFTPRLIWANTDSTQIDSLTLFDDGLHGDLQANDGIYGNHIPPQQNEDYYFISVGTIDLQTNKYFNTPDINRFTTVGPVVLDSIYWTQLSTFFYSVKPFIKNQSTATTITNASVRLICNDPWVTSITPTSSTLPNISPGAIVSPTSPFTVTINNSIFPGYFNFKVEVMSNEWIYWTDSMRVPPIAIISINPAELDFGEVAIDSSETKIFTITNYGDEDLVISNITSSEPVFTLNITSAVVLPDSSQDVEVTFTPIALQIYSGVIEIIHNAEGSPDSIIVTGDGVTDVEDNLQPIVYSLEQNYPNPFNPTTTFRYSIPQTSKVVIKVCDILGNEIATLMDEEKSVGTYELTWNAASLPSGVYFYQLKADNYTNTKKMILVK